MRVLMFTNTFPPGYAAGAEVANYHTLKGLIAQGIECSICVLRNRERESINEWYFMDDIPVHRVIIPTLLGKNALSDVFDRRLYRTAVNEIKSEKPDIIHIANVSGSSLAPYLAARKARIPVINTLHDLWLVCPNNMSYKIDGQLCKLKPNEQQCGKCFRRYDHWGNVPMRKTIFKKFTSNVYRFIAPSQALIDHHVASGYAPDRFELIPYGMESESPVEISSPILRRLLSEPYTGKTLVFGGGGLETKGAKVVARALPILREKLDSFRLIVAGDGDCLGEFTNHSEVILLGKIPFREMRRVYRLADLVLLPSVWFENLPLVIFESNQVGIPVVGSNIGGIPEIIEHNLTGYLFPVGNFQKMSEMVVRHFLKTPREIRQMKKKCRQKISREFSHELHIEKIKQTYLSALNQ